MADPAAESPKPYPGERATPAQILRLAEAYREAAGLLLPMARPRDPLSRAPWRLSAIHAVELYLNALLLHLGQTPSSIRGMQHDLSKRSEWAIERGLKLRKRTAAHLSTLVERREYTAIRYGPETTDELSQINRLTATLDEVADKVTAMMKKPAPPSSPSA